MIDAGKQCLTLKNREALTIDGVDDVLAFSDDYLEITSNMGVISVEGEELKIEGLSREKREILICGRISGIFYKDGRVEKGIFKRFFK